MTEKRPTTRRDLMKPAQLLGLALIAALFAGVVTLVSMGFFQNRFPGESVHALVVGLIVAGITFIVTIVVISLLLLMVQPEQITHPVDKPVLIARDQAVAAEKAKRADAAGPAGAGSTAAGTVGQTGSTAPAGGTDAAGRTPAPGADDDPQV
ncbi:amino acid transporter [Microbacterium luticocti]|uniref:amino acid transporter n=1 Tax=Microbacterium luticocti TaxID=451764 RepID=UPI0004204FA7|nr:amino acid transporter [Microbacterium luticocti]